jgi:hypothetical protein
VADLEAEVVERDAVAEALAQMLQRERRASAGRAFAAFHAEAFLSSALEPLACWSWRVTVS